MTCIVGIERKGNVYIGGDSAGVAGLDISTRLDEKVFKNDGFVMGFTTSFRMGQLLQYSFAAPGHVVTPGAASYKDDMAYMVTDFADAVRKLFADKGFSTKGSDKDADESDSGGTFLVGYRRKLYTVESDFQIARIQDGFHAIGCGGRYALGSLFATQQAEDNPIGRCNAALTAAEHFSAGVRAPFKIVQLVTSETAQ